MKRMIFLILLLPCCKVEKYTGYVYGLDNKPVPRVTVTALHENEKTLTDSAGYFKLDKLHDISGELVFQKVGFSTDTIASIQIQNGEQQKRRFKGERTYLLKKSYKDSIFRANGLIRK